MTVVTTVNAADVAMPRTIILNDQWVQVVWLCGNGVRDVTCAAIDWYFLHEEVFVYYIKEPRRYIVGNP